ncbi:MAG: hypothetical protein HYV76_02605 [Candidatus Vogelbacteria bacterium]|nr:hypothetical protein [Candidatus Vogelbacteria bacterium]
MFNFDRLQKLQARPHHERQVIAFTVALIITVIIALIWLVTLFKPVREAITPPIPEVPSVVIIQWERVVAGWQVVKSYLK